MLNINAHINYDCTGIDSALLSLTEGLKQTTQTTRPQKLNAKQNCGKYVDSRSNGVITRKKIMDGL